MVYYVNGSPRVGEKCSKDQKILESEPSPQADTILPEGERRSQVILRKIWIFCGMPVLKSVRTVESAQNPWCQFL
ncbi:MAG: hypothetical protein LBI05_01675 [Planctomycetaceae bacterium]|jgi:hypothetical protein|nr:hypothetical protein [Planctomycetaceae bacterium]